ncbi:hypothetical protein KIP88_05105 [Bradyrhizobium sp. SRL28]|uniref:hypothetical protein n=1 Tax=Bradyrhizobium sp. SRL28 TaxID=2836178 RepID=UPI001BDEC3C0|nr:hypothetical protein [Bradyrhizobium sp. SRL28]MBT1509874.1 hypothetical protein [Bradyrhizobium sp. SRL28]
MSTSNHFWENVQRQSLFLIQLAGKAAPQRPLRSSCNGARNHRQIVQIDDDEAAVAQPGG